MSKRDRRDGDRRGDRRDNQPEEEQQRRSGEGEVQEGDSLTALKAILSKVAALLKPLQLTPEESIRLVEELYSKVLETDLQLAAETDDTRKSSVLAAIQNATIRREGDRVTVDYSTATAEPVLPDEAAPPTGPSGQAPAAGGGGHAPAAGGVEPGPVGSATPDSGAAVAEGRPATPAGVETARTGVDAAEQDPAKRAVRRPASRRPAQAKPAAAEDQSPAD